MTQNAFHLILGSTSIYRKELLGKLGIPFTSQKPDCDEDQLTQDYLLQKKSPLEVAAGLALAKAYSVQNKFLHQPNTTVIAGDQLISLNQQILGKPKTAENAFLQLSRMSGHVHELITSVVILHDHQKILLNHVSEMQMKTLSALEIKSYILKDDPLDCAGSYKIEKSGLVLFEKIKTDDFSAIQGLPLMWISQKLKEIGYALFSENR